MGMVCPHCGYMNRSRMGSFNCLSCDAESTWKRSAPIWIVLSIVAPIAAGIWIAIWNDIPIASMDTFAFCSALFISVQILVSAGVHQLWREWGPKP